MATPLREITIGDRKYYLSHSGDTVYYSTEGPGRGTTTIRGLKFKSNQIIDTSTGKVASEYAIAQKMGK